MAGNDITLQILERTGCVSAQIIASQTEGIVS